MHNPGHKQTTSPFPDYTPQEVPKLQSDATSSGHHRRKTSHGVQSVAYGVYGLMMGT